MIKVSLSLMNDFEFEFYEYNCVLWYDLNVLSVCA